MRDYSNIHTLIDLLQHCMNCKPYTNFNNYFQRRNSKIYNFKEFDNKIDEKIIFEKSFPKNS